MVRYFTNIQTHIIIQLCREQVLSCTSPLKINFHIFDSFEGGLSKLHEKDKNLVRNLSEKDIEIQKKQFSSDEGFVQNILNEFDFVKIYKGWIQKRFSEIEIKKFLWDGQCFLLYSG